MFENTICCVYSKAGMPSVAARLSTSTFKLTLRRILCPFTRRSHRPPNFPTNVTRDPPAHRRKTKDGAGPRLPIRAQNRVTTTWGPSPISCKYAGQRVASDAPTDEPPGRPRSAACGRHACRPVWSKCRHVPKSPVARAGRHRPQAYGSQRSDARYEDEAPPVPPGARIARI